MTAGLVDDGDGSVDNLRYQWTSNGSNILGATNSTYTLQSSDVGRQIRVEITYDDGFANDNQLTSAATANVSSTAMNLMLIGGAGNNFSYAENRTDVVFQVLVNDPDPLDTVVNYRLLVDDLDNAFFDIDSSGRVRFKNSPNYENPLDGGGLSSNNIYLISVQALDSGNNVLGTVEYTVTVLDANDIGILSPISGVAQQGELLTAGTVSDEDGSVNNERYQWFSDDSEIDGATNNTYTLTTEEIGKVITVQVTYDDGFATDNQLTSGPTSFVDGDSSLNATFNDISSVSYQENLSSVVLTALATDPDDTVTGYSVTGTDSALFTISSSGALTFNSAPNFEMPSDVGEDNVYNIVVTALNSSDDALGIQPVVITVINVSELGSLSAISGVVREGEVLTVGNITDGDGSVENRRYQWLSDDVEIASATSSTYTLQSSDVGTAISVMVTYDDGFGVDNPLTSGATPLVSSSSANTVFDSSATVDYMENSNALVLTVLASDPDVLDTVADYSITGGDSALFTISSSGELTFNSVPNFEFPSDDGGDNIYNLNVNALDSSDNILGSQSIVVTVVNVDESGSLSTISGVAREGEILTASLVFDIDGDVENRRYQWFSDDVEIASATSSTYTLRSSDVGTAISVRVTYDDGFGTDHQLTSGATLLIF